MKAARKARQNTLGTARRKAHTPRHTQRRITVESTRRRLAPASLHATRHLCYARQAPPHRRESAHAATFVNSMPLLHACPAPTHRRKRTPRHTQRRITAESTRRRLAPASLHAAQYLRYTRPAPTHRRESARRDIRQFDALATRAPHFQRPRASRRTRFRSARHPFSSCADVTFIL